ncbi:Hypothetical predicted protein [Mytilus galloprovincialis]|uniref:DDE Tnp4 domain-containing protein n=1 Tax=Mytilus galloprovincialis TaxID=29158 RepID=A0A8B6C6J6_MYTGA|nr:Hypothetical predicted protein [Mytilus galloprovincialis]
MDHISPSKKWMVNNITTEKKFPSIILQAVCDKNLHFLDLYCGWPGSVHDLRVLKNSPLFTSASDNKERMFPGNTHLIGDAAYASNQWVMTPFKDFGNLSAEQKRYNYIHSSSRMCIERAFGELKGRFRCFRYIDMKDMPEVMYSSSQDSSSIVLTGTLSSVDTSALTKSPLQHQHLLFTSKAISTASSTCVPSYNEDRQKCRYACDDSSALTPLET